MLTHYSPLRGRLPFVTLGHKQNQTPSTVLNLSNYNKNGSPEAPHFTWVIFGLDFSGAEKGMRETRVEWTEFNTGAFRDIEIGR